MSDVRRRTAAGRLAAIVALAAGPMRAQSPARALGLRPELVTASQEHDFETVFAELHRMQADALLIAVDAFFNSKSERLAELASRHSLPTISAYREFATAGGLLSYGGSISEARATLGSTLAASSPARGRRTCRSSRRPGSSWCSISRRRRRSASRFRKSSCPAPRR